MPQQVMSPPRVTPEPPSRGLAVDLFRGVVVGDFDQQLGAAGAAAQSVVGFIPVVGTLAALRDLLACIGQRDALGIVLNLLAIFPVFGGLAKTADALHALHRYQRASQRRKQRAMNGGAYLVASPVPHQNGWATFGLSLLVSGAAALYGVGVRTLFEFLRANGPTIQGYTLRGDGAWLAPLILLSVGVVLGLIVTIGNRLWLGLLLFPVTLAVGYSAYLMWW